MTPQTQAAINLTQFDHTFLKPTVSAYSNVRATRVRHYEDDFKIEVASQWQFLRFSELVTTYFWLDLGAEIGFFPREQAENLVRVRLQSPLLNEQLESNLIYLGHLFPPELSRMLLQARRSQELRADPVDPDLILSSPYSSSAFRSAIITETLLIRSQPAESVLTLLNFAPGRLDSLLVGNEPIRIGDAPLIDVAILAQGFADVIDYMERLNSLSMRLLSQRALPSPARNSLERRIRQLTRWRINRFGSDIGGDFLRVGQFVCYRFDLDWETAEPRFQDLLNSWGFTHEKAMNA